MKRKYYLRGMGVGILVTALIFSLALLFEKPKLSDEEIIKQAKKLGMVEADTASSASSGEAADSAADENGSNDSSNAATKAENGTSSADGISSASEDETRAGEASGEGADAAGDAAGSDAGDSTDTLSEAQAAADAKAAEDAINNTDLSDASTAYKANSTGDSTENAPSGLISVTVSPGQNSAKVAENFYRAGLVDDPIGFNDYLEQNGYDARIRPGTYNIAAGSDYAKIANAIASKK